MADLPNAFWSGWIIVVTVVSLLALVWLLVTIYFPSKKSAELNHAEPVWDETLKEGTSPPPLWWFWFVFCILIISVIYLMLFPGLGAYKGLLNWSQDSRLKSSYAQYDARFAAVRQQIVDSEYVTLRNDPEMMKSADRVFQQHCSGCHGENAKGRANRFPSLVDGDWQWGGSPESIAQTIRKGRLAAMPAWQPALGDDGVTELANYVKQFSKPGREERPGHTKYTQMCAACHGFEGKGNPQLGAPNLTDLTWLYGHTIDQIKVSVGQGRNGQMPAFEKKLDETQIKLLIARFSQ